MRKIEVRLGSSGYNIYIGAGLLEQAGSLLKESGLTGKLVIITNHIVKELYGDALKQNLGREDFTVAILQVPDGEEQKSLETASRLYKELSDFYTERTTPILALGGGVIGDLAGFVAATYMRGVPLIQMPTTLLAQVDSSIGGKVAVDHCRLKNIIGVFYQPRLVIADVDTWKTLPAKALIDELAEVIKYAVIEDIKFFDYLEENLDRVKSLDSKVLEEVIFRSAKIKAAIVEKDERDSGLRNILNYGHTIGHAIESASNFKMGHGEAVAIGMLAAARISNRLGILDKNELIRLKDVIEGVGLSVEIPKLDIGKVIQAIKHDKKISRGKIRFILPKSIGNVFITDEVNLSLVEHVLEGWNEKT